MRIFVSYGRPDRQRVEALAAALVARGHEVWWDRQILGGSAFAQEIETRLAAAERVIVAWSSASVASDWVRDEAGVARDRGILVPLLLDATPPPLGFRQYQTIDLSHWRGAPDAAEIDALDAALGGTAAPAAATPRSAAAATPAASRRRWLPWAAGAAVVAAVAGVFVLRPAATDAATTPHVALGKFETISANLAPGFAAQLGAETMAAFGTESRVAVAADDGRGGGGVWRLSGSVTADDKGVAVIARVVDPASGIAVWTPRLELERKYTGAAPRLLGARIAGGVRCLLRATRARPVLGTEALTAWGKYCADAVATEDDYARFAVADARRVTAVAPGFAAGWGALSDALSTNNVQDSRAELETVSKRALALDPNEAFGWSGFGWLALYRADFAAADAFLVKGIAANPGDCACQVGQRAFLLGSVGRLRDTVPLLERALALEPLQAGYQMALADARGYVGEFADAERSLKAAGEQDPTLPVDVVRFEVAMWAKNYPLARSLEGSADDPLRPARAALVEAAARGDTAAMLRAADALDRGFESLPAMLRNPALMLIEIGGRGDRAAARIEARVADHHVGSLLLLFSPPMDSWRHTPEFAAMAHRVHLVDYWRIKGNRPDFCTAAGAPAICAELGTAARSS